MSSVSVLDKVSALENRLIEVLDRLKRVEEEIETLWETVCSLEEEQLPQLGLKLRETRRELEALQWRVRGY